MPLIVIELRIWVGETEAIIVPETVVANESLDVAGIAGPVGGKARTEEDWKEDLTEEAWLFREEFRAWAQKQSWGSTPRLQPKVVYRSPAGQTGLGASLAAKRRCVRLPPRSRWFP